MEAHPSRDQQSAVRLLVLLLALRSGGASRTGPTADILVAFLKEAHVTRTPATVLQLLCSTRGAVSSIHQLSTAGFSTLLLSEPVEWLPAVRALANSAHTVVLDTTCSDARDLLISANKEDMFRGPRRWVLLLSDGYHPEKETICHYQLETNSIESDVQKDCNCRTASLLDGLSVFYDSDVSALCLHTMTKSAVSVAAHRVGRGAELRLQRAASWRALEGGGVDLVLDPSPDRRPVAARRFNFNREICNIGYLVIDPKNFEKDLKESTGVSIDYLATFGWELSHDMVAMLNMTVNVTMTPDWGLGPPNVKPNKGLLGLHANQQIEFGGTGFTHFLEPQRLSLLHFTGFYCPVGGVMVFRAPPLSTENNVFTLPFPLTLWEASLGMVGLCALLLIVVMHAERVILHQGEANDALHSGSDAILLTIAAVCQQGSPVETRGVPGRIITLLLFLLVLLLYTCYSASIVVLMQQSSSTIKHFRDLPDSQMKCGAVDVSYVWYYMKVEEDPVRQRVYQKKMLTKGKTQNVYSLSEGVRKVRQEYFGFFGIRNHIFAEISRTWQEHEKCGLVTIGYDFVRVKDPEFTITRGSYRVDAYKIMLLRLRERGCWHRMKRRFVREKPSCANTDAVFHSVSLTDCRGAFYMFLVTMAASVVVFLLELAAHHRQLRVQRARSARDAKEAADQRKLAFGLVDGDGASRGIRAVAVEWNMTH